MDNKKIFLISLVTSLPVNFLLYIMFGFSPKSGVELYQPLIYMVLLVLIPIIGYRLNGHPKIGYLIFINLLIYSLVFFYLSS